MIELLDCRDENGRHWIVITRPGLRVRDQQIVDSTCYRSNGRGKSLRQSAAYGPEGWDLLRWFPRSPAPVPEAILENVERQLKELVRQQQAQIQEDNQANG